MRKKSWLVAAAVIPVLTVVVVGGVLLASRPGGIGAHTTAERAARSPSRGTELDSAGIPTMVTDLASWQQNGEGGRYYAPVIVGAEPRQATLGTVRSDTDCAPDAEGLSHCHNVIELLSGGSITIQDNHNMMVNRCLEPGEEVTVTPLAPGWVKLQTRAT